MDVYVKIVWSKWRLMTASPRQKHTEGWGPAHVLLSIDEYRRITGQTESIVDLLAMEGDVSWESLPRT